MKMRKIGLGLAVCALVLLTVLSFQAWRQAGFALLPISIPFC